MRSIRILLSSAFAGLLAIAGIALTPGSAYASDAYLYWAYFHVQDGEFVSADTGPADSTPADGDIQGYRWAAPADFTNPNLPRADLQTLTFDAVCADDDAGADQKRVAVLIDYGVEQDSDGATPPAPQALCAVVPTDANGMQVLEAVAPKVRTQAAGFGPMLCGINDYPTTGCSDQIADEGTPADGAAVEFVIGSEQADDNATTAADDDDGSSTGLLIGAVVVVLVVTAGGVYLSRRRAATDE